jgi:hypothetical protein
VPCPHVMIDCGSVEVTARSGAGQGRVRAWSDPVRYRVTATRNGADGTMTGHAPKQRVSVHYSVGFPVSTQGE